MLRSEVVNTLLKLYHDPKYLEVGVWRGDTFDAVNAPEKVAVDPEFMFDHTAAERAKPGVSYYRKTSNDFFTSPESREGKFDVIFLDGLHTLEQTLTDLNHAVDRTKKGGVIIVDDVIPDSYAASLPSQNDCFRLRHSFNDNALSWMGDVYKLVFFIDSFMLNWSFATVAENHGQLIMWRKPRVSGTGPSALLSSVSQTEYKDTVFRRDVFNIKPLDQIIEEIKLFMSYIR